MLQDKLISEKLIPEKLIGEHDKIFPIHFEKSDPDEIIELNYDWRQVRGLPPIRMTRREYWKKLSREYRQDVRRLKKILTNKSIS